MKRTCLIPIVLLLCLACSKEDNVPVPQPDSETAIHCQVMVVFAPGQLGDRGYADNVLQGVSRLIHYNDTVNSSPISADFISRFDYVDTQEAMEDWLANPVSPVNGKTYTRRLLVLTEQFMAGWLSKCTELLRDSDEVLMLKAIQEDVDAVNETLHLGNRLHAVNISMAEPIRMFISNVRWYVDFYERDSIYINISNMPVFRLYGRELTAYRDSVYEALTEELGADLFIRQSDFYKKGSDGYPQFVENLNSLEQKLDFMVTAFQQFWKENTLFPICDLGATNNAIDFFLLNNQEHQTFKPLLLDIAPSKADRFYILRPFDRVLANWIGLWMNSRVGEMPVSEVHGHWDGFPCETNLTYIVDQEEDFDDEEYYDDEEYADE